MCFIGLFPYRPCKLLGLKYIAENSLQKNKIEKARKQAVELLELSQGNSKNKVDGDGIHQANIIFGKIYLKEENLEKAKEKLLQAGKTPGSPVLNSFGPNMSLAKELLLKGEEEVVLEYFGLCSKFWQNNTLTLWETEIRAGRVPSFRGNLLY